MEYEFSRTEALLGEAALQKLAAARVAVFGVGGVGGYAVEALVRAGVGALDLIDGDTVSVTNINRQILALQSTLGAPKAEVAAARAADINPNITARAFRVFFRAETAAQFDFSQYDYVVDAVDDVAAKILLAQTAKAAGVPLISAMGAGNKLDPCAFRVTDLAKTAMDPLARVMRRELGKRGIKHLKVVCSAEPPHTPIGNIPADEAKKADGTPHARRAIPASISFVPPVAGLVLASAVVKDLIEK